jgi:peptide chain release factor 2
MPRKVPEGRDIVRLPRASAHYPFPRNNKVGTRCSPPWGRPAGTLVRPVRNFADDLATLSKRLEEAESYLGLESLRGRLADLEQQVGAPDLWDDQDRGRRVSGEYAEVKSDVDVLEALRARFEDAEVLHEMAREADDETQEGEIATEVAALSKTLDELELRSLFTGDHDQHDAVVSISAKDGGTDAQDWAEMLERMYLRWAERRGFTVEPVDRSMGTEAGILSTEFIVRGRYAYGLLTSEKGVHRLVRNSPFDSQHRRQTSFALVQVVPFLEDALKEVEIDDKDIRLDTFRSSGAGGQHVNKTSSAIRITHFPSGIVVQCQDERSQLQNKERAFQILAVKLLEVREEERRQELARLNGEVAKTQAWGSQIRNYVTSQYNMVKDDRTKHETSNVQAVFDGDLDPFMEAYLRWRRASG